MALVLLGATLCRYRGRLLGNRRLVPDVKFHASSAVRRCRPCLVLSAARAIESIQVGRVLSTSWGKRWTVSAVCICQSTCDISCSLFWIVATRRFCLWMNIVTERAGQRLTGPFLTAETPSNRRRRGWRSSTPPPPLLLLHSHLTLILRTFSWFR